MNCNIEGCPHGSANVPPSPLAHFISSSTSKAVPTRHIPHAKPLHSVSSPVNSLSTSAPSPLVVLFKTASSSSSDKAGPAIPSSAPNRWLCALLRIAPRCDSIPSIYCNLVQGCSIQYRSVSWPTRQGRFRDSTAGIMASLSQRVFTLRAPVALASHSTVLLQQLHTKPISSLTSTSPQQVRSSSVSLM